MEVPLVSLCCYVVKQIFHHLDLECCSCVRCFSSVIYLLVLLMNVGAKGRIFGVKFVPGNEDWWLVMELAHDQIPLAFYLSDGTLMFYSISTKNTYASRYTLLTIHPCLVCMLVPPYRQLKGAP